MANIRTFGIQTLGTLSQPAFGTVLTASSTLSPDQFTNKVGPGNNPSLSYFSVLSSIGFKVGDRVIVGPRAQFVNGCSVIFNAGQTGLDVGTIHQIIPGSPYDKFVVQDLKVQHTGDEYILLNEDASNVKIIPVNVSDLIYVGQWATVSASDPYVFDVITPYAGVGNLTYWHDSPTTGGSNTYKTSEFWLLGTAGNTFLARFSQSG
jgi:hypothetical protein